MSLTAEQESRRWKKEILLSGKRERDWEREGEKIVKRYRGEEKKRNRYNVLWANTEILRPAIYNSRPNPDVRRRFRDADPVGKAVSEVLERSLQVFLDGDAFDDAAKNDVLDALLPGRGISRIRYVPKISTTETEEAEDENDTSDTEATADEPNAAPDQDKADAEGDAEPNDLPDEEVESETVEIVHIDWKDFRHGYGRTWVEVPWTGFRHKLTRAEAEEKFGEDEPALAKVEFTVPVADEYKKPGDQVGETEKIAEFWEVWDKVASRVFFVHEEVEQLLYPKDNPDGEPPLDFDGFFPCPRPLMLIENTGSLLPTPPFRLYETEAAQLDMLSMRIDKIIKGTRLRGVYDAKMPEMKDLLSSDDNEMIPVQNAQAWKDGGLDAAVSWFPVEQAAKVLEGLYMAREKQKAIIDELTGIADIMRGATDPNETLGAQEIKSTYGSIRLQRMQKEVQRYVCDLLRLAAAAMCQKFSPETFTEMSELKFPTPEQKQMMIMAFQRQQAMMPPQPGGPSPGGGGAPGPATQPPAPAMDPAMLKVPTWDDILGLMHSPKLRQFKIDIETDSTIAGTLSSDMAGLSEVLKAIAGAMTELAPMVSQGVLPVDAAKEVILTVIRRARMGMAVEDAFDKLSAPKPQPSPHDTEMAKVQAQGQSQVQVAQAKAHAEAGQFQAEEQARMQSEAMKERLEQQRIAQDAQTKMQLDAAEKQHQMQLEQVKQEAAVKLRDAELLNARVIADANNQTKVLVAQIAAGVQRDKQAHEQQMAAIQPNAATEEPDSNDEEAPPAADYAKAETELTDLIKNLTATMNRPRQVIRDMNGRISGLQ